MWPGSSARSSWPKRLDATPTSSARLGRELRLSRLRRRMTQAQLAAIVGVVQSPATGSRGRLWRHVRAVDEAGRSRALRWCWPAARPPPVARAGRGVEHLRQRRRRSALDEPKGGRGGWPGGGVLGEGRHTVAGCWVVRATRRNRALVLRCPELFSSRSRAHPRAGVGALTAGTTAPAEPGLISVRPGRDPPLRVATGAARPGAGVMSGFRLAGVAGS